MWFRPFFNPLNEKKVMTVLRKKSKRPKPPSGQRKQIHIDVSRFRVVGDRMLNLVRKDRQFHGRLLNQTGCSIYLKTFFPAISVNPYDFKKNHKKIQFPKLDQMELSIAAFDAQFNFNKGSPPAYFAKTIVW